MGFVQGEGRTQGTLFPVTLEELITFRVRGLSHADCYS